MDTQIQDETKPLFTILMSIFEPNLDYIRDQITSIGLQEGVEIRVLVRFDQMESDIVLKVLKIFNEKKIHFDYVQGENIGACASFFNLISIAPRNSYIAFADQDDIWHPKKLIRSYQLMDREKPVLAVVGTQNIDDNMTLAKMEFNSFEKLKNLPLPSFRNALAENIFQGASMSLNPVGLLLLQSKLPDAQKIVMHDAWMYLVFASEGLIRFDDTVLFFYRQHEGNLIGASASKLRKRIIRYVLGGYDRRFSMAEEFVKCFPRSENAEIAKLFAQIPQIKRVERWRHLRRINLERQNKFDLMLLYLALLLP